MLQSATLEAELGPAPMPALGIVSDFVVRLEPEPVRNLAILLSFPGQLLLDEKGLMRRLEVSTQIQVKTVQDYGSRLVNGSENVAANNANMSRRQRVWRLCSNRKIYLTCPALPLYLSYVNKKVFDF